MSITSNAFIAKTSLDYMAEGYWQDFLTGNSVAGGIAYESLLQSCQLDESPASLQRVDTLLSQIRRDISKGFNDAGIKSDLSETALLTDDRYRQLCLFLAFYAGRVLAAQWQTAPHWYSQNELKRRYPALSLMTDNFYQEMAVVYNDIDADNRNDSDENTDSLFFALEPIGLRLFGNIDRQILAVQGGQVDSGLYQAVKMRSPNTDVTDKLSTTIRPDNHPATSDESQPPSIVADTNSIEEAASSLATQSLPESPAVAPSLVDESHQTTVIETQHITAEELSQDMGYAVENVLTEQPVNNADNTSISHPNHSSNADSLATSEHLDSNNAPPTIEIFTRLLAELDEIEVVQSAGIADYQQARKTLDQFERHIARQTKPRAQVAFSDAHQHARQQALTRLKKSAEAGNTAAMLRLAMYELLDEGLVAKEKVKSDEVAIDENVGVSLVKKAAAARDCRAQRLLSKLYYQGFGVSQSIDTGRYWLEQAADSGHPEAITINNEWQRAQLLITAKNQEQHSLKRYQLLIGAILIAAILLIIFV